jgi:hypothetical protein
MQEDFAYPDEQVYMVREMYSEMAKMIRKYPRSFRS